MSERVRERVSGCVSKRASECVMRLFVLLLLLLLFLLFLLYHLCCCVLRKGPAEHNWGLSIDHGAWGTDWDNNAFALRRATDADWARHEQARKSADIRPLLCRRRDR